MDAMTYLTPAMRVKFRMLAISQVNFVLLFCFGIEAEINLLSEIVSIEDKTNGIGLGDEDLRLFNLSTILPRLATIP